MARTVNLEKFGLSESSITDLLQSQFDKLAQSSVDLAVCICGGTDRQRANLACAVFKADYADAVCQCIESAEDAPPCDLLWHVGDRYTSSAHSVVAWSVERLSGSKRAEFIRRQIVDVDLKEQLAMRAIKQHCAIAFGVGFVPIPFADAPILVANELAIFARVLAAYDMTSVKEVIATIGLNTIIGNVLTLLGKSMAGRILKFIPVIGTLAGGVITGSVATAVAFAFGVSVSKTMKMLHSESASDCLHDADAVADVITGTALRCLEEGRVSARDYERFDLETKDLIENMARGREFFEEFVKENARADAAFHDESERGAVLSKSMWDAIARL